MCVSIMTAVNLSPRSDSGGFFRYHGSGDNA